MTDFQVGESWHSTSLSNLSKMPGLEMQCGVGVYKGSWRGTTSPQKRNHVNVNPVKVLKLRYGCPNSPHSTLNTKHNFSNL
jgi:hypothetical protein